ncbi:hypothetical protein ACFV9C_42595 [Kribbella sp. NPDC059898]|uniref:hypothetical protein n=1 Tax=Kribbella sp. NPDC059898 TaxID=3346995 RepID=UPI0036591057
MNARIDDTSRCTGCKCCRDGRCYPALDSDCVYDDLYGYQCPCVRPDWQEEVGSGLSSWRALSAIEPGAPQRPNEDWFGVGPGNGTVVVVDGGTARTETGCSHGVAWYAGELGSSLLRLAREDSRPALGQVLAAGIDAVAGLHRGSCDLGHPGTPSAAAAIVRQSGPVDWEYVVLGDVSVVLDTPDAPDGPVVVVDTRISESARVERAEADQWPIGSGEKEAAMIRMKHAELAARNQTYWIAAADPRAAAHGLTGEVGSVIRLAVLTDGAARAHSFGLMTWPDLLQTMDQYGPQQIIERVRTAENADPDGRRWPRNKKSDDATAVYLDRHRG